MCDITGEKKKNEQYVEVLQYHTVPGQGIIKYNYDQ